jgi:hypothetical protein
MAEDAGHHFAPGILVGAHFSAMGNRAGAARIA